MSRDRAELAAAAFLGVAAAAGSRRSSSTSSPTTPRPRALPGARFLGVAGALIVAGLRLHPPQKVVGERPAPTRRPRSRWSRPWRGRSGGISRRRLLAGAAGAAGAALGGALIVPLGSLGPFEQGESFDDLLVEGRRAPRGRRGCAHPRRRAQPRAFTAAFPRAPTSASSARRWWCCGCPRARTTSTPSRRRSPRAGSSPSRASAPTPAVPSPSRTPLFPPKAPSPALVCPCHYSTFDVRQAGKVIFGPAGRDLPQLPCASATTAS